MDERDHVRTVSPISLVGVIVGIARHSVGYSVIALSGVMVALIIWFDTTDGQSLHRIVTKQLKRYGRALCALLLLLTAKGALWFGTAIIKFVKNVLKVQL